MCVWLRSALLPPVAPLQADEADGGSSRLATFLPIFFFVLLLGCAALTLSAMCAQTSSNGRRVLFGPCPEPRRTCSLAQVRKAALRGAGPARRAVGSLRGPNNARSRGGRACAGKVVGLGMREVLDSLGAASPRASGPSTASFTLDRELFTSPGAPTRGRASG